MDLAIVLYTINAVLFAALALIYGRTAVSTRAKYAVGLCIFATLLLVHSAGTSLAYLLLGSYFGDEAVPFMAAMGGVELVGVSALVKITI